MKKGEVVGDGLQNGCDTCYHVWFGGDSIDKDRDEQAECYRAEDVKISPGVTRMDEIKNEHIRGTAVFGMGQDLWT